VKLTWQEQQVRQQQERQVRQQQERLGQQRQQQERQEQRQELQQQEQEQERLLLFCRKRSRTGPAGRRAGRNVSFIVSFRKAGF
jgi:hypothetical protein